ncbi:hypothetical protein P152DRAFT_440327 [Eremomyces bilateralis CBS 781.70]|uniref:Uncharacterized protein n=1 Tax=Eremomyces bilateralis CBS 781.70 TaxID=1392243 RepID=A0A6G1FX42_9PEZI|nr:uncharacterized protein P152DRAFT_440327 [Eremomyces bilateralis CBS 781.70]KAF1810189.1 hypothetical protein P152DRAFT_440327 [Eremomyces bilateralis CBS 781.70]
MSSGKAPLGRTPSQRLPAPSLFVGPPSRNASATSLLSPQVTASGRVPLIRQRSHTATRKGAPGGGEAEAGPSTLQKAYPRRQDPEAHLEQRRNERTDAAWAELQNTLEEVELCAMNETHIFGPNHAKALDDLRTAQLALAQAWAKGEIEDESEATTKDTSGNVPECSNALDQEADRKGAGPSQEKDAGRNRSSSLEEETENDILLARKRREANDRHFKKVNTGVLDVVAKLGEVSKAMKEVEIESREIWGEGESLDMNSVNASEREAYRKPS